MLSSEGKAIDLADIQEVGKQALTDTPIQWEHGWDREQMFWLIESVLSFEACLYHQILPLGIQEDKLTLGMVNPQDTVALDYVNRLLPYINCTMMTEAITAENHLKILSAYLNYKNTLPLASPPIPSPLESASKTTSSDKTLIEQNSTNVLNEKKTSKVVLSNNLHILHLSDAEEFTPTEMLPNLPPKILLEELLGRVLAGGIGRLYLERHPYHGRILWSENGVLQSVLDKLPLSMFQGVLNELKRLASLPIVTITEPKQVEKECSYQQNRLLLRLRVMPGMYGEEATLQVLRGAALKFYQQQQLTRLSCDTLGIFQQLSYKLHELQQRFFINRDGNSKQLEAFNSIKKLLANLDQQIRIITQDSNLQQ
jgi:type II secretory ATPase GspE/PulE/Tfp pilus assembly ATPase PilB-like protein